MTFPDGRGDQSWSYEKDGAVSYIVTNNASGGEQVINRYAYNKRRMLTSESIEQPGWYMWSSGYAYDGNGALARQTFPPTGLSVDYAPNALGQATRAGPYATNVSYYPNGAIKQFTYGNGIVHTMTQNARQLPSRTSDLGAPNTALDYEYSYDQNGNVSYIGDFALGSSYSRWMSYDGLDRLTAVGSAMFGGDHWHRFTYDTLDNLKTWKLAGVKDHNYYYDPSQNRLTNVNTSTGAGIIGLSYDVQGNLSNRNGQGYYFDFGNRLRSVANKDVYRYDGHGRRVLAWGAMPGSILSQYAQSGQLVFQQNQRKNTNIDHIYLAGSLVATREYNYATGVRATRYQHTDAVGSPVAITNEAAQVVERTQWEPFGAAINKAIEGVGYTGHVMDAQTGLTYMQQRYYDPQIGRFLSVDPVTADGMTGANFNRYWYANNNPYYFTDPDGRQSAPSWAQGFLPRGTPVALRDPKIVAAGKIIGADGRLVVKGVVTTAAVGATGGLAAETGAVATVGSGLQRAGVVAEAKVAEAGVAAQGVINTATAKATEIGTAVIAKVTDVATQVLTSPAAVSLGANIDKVDDALTGAYVPGPPPMSPIGVAAGLESAIKEEAHRK